MYKSLLITHQVVVTLFFLIYVVKTILLLGNKSDLLVKFSKAVKVPEMIVSFLFLATGIYLMTQAAVISHFLIIKITLVALSIPVAVVGFKKGNKILGALSLLMITAAYGLGEVSHKRGARIAAEAAAGTSGVPAAHPQAEAALNNSELYLANCALCHGADGKLGMAGAADISKTVLDAAAIKATILNGKGIMAAVPVSPEQAEAIAAYVESSIKGK